MRSLRTPKAFAVFASVVCVIASLNAAQSDEPLSQCGPPIPLSGRFGTESNPYPVPTYLFEGGKYQLALRAFYQTYRCAGTPLYSGLNPAASDVGLDKPFDEGMREAELGDYRDAIATFSIILARAPEFGDVRLLKGICEWALGKHSRARTTWAAVSKSEYFTLPPDFGSPLIFAAAKRLLIWSNSRS